MAANLSSQVVATQLEQISPQLGYFLTKLQSNFAKKFQNNAKKHRVSAWTAGSGAVQAWRIPILQSNGGDYAALNLDSGDLGTGSMMQAQYMALSYFASNTAFYVPALAAMATKTNKQAAINVLERDTNRPHHERECHHGGRERGPGGCERELDPQCLV